MFRKIPGNVQEDSGECSIRFREMSLKIPGNVIKYSGECSRRFQGMFQKIPGNPNFDLFLETLLVFLSNIAVKVNRSVYIASRAYQFC